MNDTVKNTNSLEQRLKSVKQRLELACHEARRELTEVSLLAVSKKQSVEKIRELYALGHRDFAENYLNELQEKVLELHDLKEIRWHYIGLLQSHKLTACFQYAQEIQTLSSLKHAHKLNQLAKNTETSYPVYIQVNPEKEVSKGGVFPENFAELHHKMIKDCPNLLIQGVMGIPTPLPDLWPKTSIPPSYQLLKELADTTPGRQLSLGMSSDLEIAVLAGSTCIRIGEALFGPRL